MGQEKKAIKILLVEDNPHVQEMLSYGLERSAPSIMDDSLQPIEIKTAGDGSEAYALLEKDEYALLITDLYMPVLDGKELIKKLKLVEKRDIKVLAISASSVSAHEDAIAAGADVFLRKPVRLADLVEAVRDLLHK